MGTIKASEELHTIENPLELIYDYERFTGYRVNKPDQKSQTVVSLEYAEDLKAQVKQLKEALKELIDTCTYVDKMGYTRARITHVEEIEMAEQALKDTE